MMRWNQVRMTYIGPLEEARLATIFLLNQSFIALQFIVRNSPTVCEFYPQAEYEKLPAGVQAVMVKVVVFV